MKIGIASRPFRDLLKNGDVYVAEEWGGKTLLAVIDGLGHGEEAYVASTKAKEYILQNRTKGLEELILDMNADLSSTRGIVIALVKIDRKLKQLSFCGIGNIEGRIIGEPPMHPPSLDGIVGLKFRKVKEFIYQFDLLKAVILHSDGISSKFDLTDYPTLFEQPQKVSEQIMAKWGNDNDDCTVLIAVEDQ